MMCVECADRPAVISITNGCYVYEVCPECAGRIVRSGQVIGATTEFLEGFKKEFEGRNQLKIVEAVLKAA